MPIPGIPDDYGQIAQDFGRSALAAISATTTLAICTPTTNRLYRVTRAELIVDATYADDAANYYVFTLQAGATVIATWSTLTGAQGALTANVPVAMVLSATDANLVVAAGTALTLVCTKHASAANVQPTIVVHGKTI